MSKSKLPKLDEYHYHEIVDRLHVIMCMIDDHLQQHPVAKVENEASQLISNATDNLWQAYQLLGSKRFDINNKT